MSDRSTTSPILPIAVTLTVLLGLYVGAYFWMVKPAAVPYGNGIGPMYRIGETSVSRFGPLFVPIHWLDRRLRPDAWEHR